MGSNRTSGTVVVQVKKDYGRYYAQSDMDYPGARGKTVAASKKETNKKQWNRVLSAE
jgi:hypothetical protein